MRFSLVRCSDPLPTLLQVRADLLEHDGATLGAIDIHGGDSVVQVTPTRSMADDNMVKMAARVLGCIEMKMMTWQHVIGLDFFSGD